MAGLTAAAAQAAEVGGRALAPGDCVMFREGGEGRLFKAPTYWLRGTVREVATEPHWAGRCPDLGKPRSAFTPDDWARLVAASPCVEREDEAREVERTRVRIAVDAWETPWSYSHGSAGWLFRGRFLGHRLTQGEALDLDAHWLTRCEADASGDASARRE